MPEFAVPRGTPTVSDSRRLDTKDVVGTTEKMTVAEQDYRASHLQKGGEYDAYLAESPFDAQQIWSLRQLR